MTKEEKFQAADELFGLREKDILDLGVKLISFGDNPIELRKLPRNERRNYYAYSAWISWLKSQEEPIEVTE